eukprot:257307-Chlamydomonas_euryale.AAC.1
MAGTEGALGTYAQPDRGEGGRLDGGCAAERGAPASGAGQPALARVRVRGRWRGSLGGAARAQGHHHSPTHPAPTRPNPNSPVPLLPP